MFSAYLEKEGLSSSGIEILRTVDKLRKIGEDETKRLLVDITGSEEKADGIISFITAGNNSSFMETLEKLETLSGGRNESSERMREIYQLLSSLGIEKSFVFDPSITRGLDYYTGIVYETFLDDLPSIGSVCSGGRYNNLASLYMKEQLPGVGSSIGLDRLLAALEELKSPLLEKTEAAEVLIIPETGKVSDALNEAEKLRSNGISTDVYLIPDAKMKKIYAYAEAKEIPYMLTFKEGKAEVKDLTTREMMTEEEAIQRIGERNR